MAITTAQSAHAGDDSGPWRTGVFGTLGALYHDADGVAYRRTLQSPRGSDAGELSFGQDSLLGAQINGRANSHVEGMLQAVSRWRPDNSWRPEVTWAYLRLTTDDTVVLRLGRVGADSQINAESRLVGYASLAIRSAHDLHVNITPDYLDGGDLQIIRPLGAGIATAKVFYGTTETEVSSGSAVGKLPETLSRGLILGYSTDPWNGRVYGGVASLRNQGSSQALLDGVRAVPAAQYQAAADALDVRGTKLRFYGADVTYDASPLTLQASIMKQVGEDEKPLVPGSLAAAYLAGYRFGKFTPYAQYSRLHKQTQATLPALGLVPALDSAVQTAVDSSQHYQRTRGVGLRVDFAPRFAFKFQVDRVTARYSPLVTHTSRPSSERIDFTLFGAALDFAF